MVKILECYGQAFAMVREAYCAMVKPTELMVKSLNVVLNLPRHKNLAKILAASPLKNGYLAP